jgi:multiple sugar transport system substrate-binding protein
MKRCFRWALALLVAAMAVTARAETTITVASFPSFDESVKAAIPLWEKKHPDIKIKLQSLAFGDHHNAMITALASGTNLPDVMAVEISFIGRFAESKGALEDLGAAPYNGKALLSQLLPFTRSQAQSGTGMLAAMPADVGPGTLFYRKDIMDKAGVTEADLTKSWESYIEAGKKVKAATGAYLLAHANDIKDIYIRANLKDGEGIYFGKGNKVLVDSPRFKKAFELAKQARAAGIDAKVGAWSNEWAEGFKRGTIATQAIGAWLAGHLNNWIAPDTKGLWRAAQLPAGSFATWGGSFYAIPAKAEHKKEAWEFIKFMCLDKEQQLNALKALDAWPALIAAQNDPFIHQPMPFLGGQKARELWKVAAEKAPAIVVNKLDPVANDIVNAELEQVLEKDKPIDQALKDAQSQIERRIRK